MPKSYPPEFRRRVVDLCRAGRVPREVAGDLGVSEATVYRWIAQDEVDLGERPGVRSGEQEELSRARARIRELEVELALTRKASALFKREGEERSAPKGLPGDRKPGRAGHSAVLDAYFRSVVGWSIEQPAGRGRW